MVEDVLNIGVLLLHVCIGLLNVHMDARQVNMLDLELSAHTAQNSPEIDLQDHRVDTHDVVLLPVQRRSSVSRLERAPFVPGVNDLLFWLEHFELANLYVSSQQTQGHLCDLDVHAQKYFVAALDGNLHCRANYLTTGQHDGQ